MTEVFIALRGQLSRGPKEKLHKAGVVVVEVDDLDAVKFVRSASVSASDESLAQPDDLLAAAMTAMVQVSDNNYAHHIKRAFAENVAAIVRANYEADS